MGVMQGRAWVGMSYQGVVHGQAGVGAAYLEVAQGPAWCPEGPEPSGAGPHSGGWQYGRQDSV